MTESVAVKNGKYGFRPECKVCYAAKRKARKREEPRIFLLHHAKQRAKEKGLEFNLTIDDLSVPDLCPLLDIPLSVGDGKLHDNSPTLDRIDNAKGYVPGNVSVISYKANRIKSNATLKELRLLVERLVQESEGQIPEVAVPVSPCINVG